MNNYKTIFISDLHIGSNHFKYELLLDFLHNNKCENLYLVGDIIDGWKLKNKCVIPNNQVMVIRKILKMMKKGINIYYCVGNHDEFIRPFLKYGIELGNIKFSNKFDYISNGKKYLVIHGDAFDGISDKAKWLCMIGDIGYDISLLINSYYNKFRNLLGMDYWSISKFLKHKVKERISIIFEFEDNVSTYANKKEYHGVICGHIHTAEIREVNGIQYMNCGDWVESCTALVETFDGEFKIIHWS